jgi:hypothetical protein
MILVRHKLRSVLTQRNAIEIDRTLKSFIRAWRIRGLLGIRSTFSISSGVRMRPKIKVLLVAKERRSASATTLGSDSRASRSVDGGMNTWRKHLIGERDLHPGALHGRNRTWGDFCTSRSNTILGGLMINALMLSSLRGVAGEPRGTHQRGR